MIEFYQKTLSPDHGPLKDLHPFGYCRHTPTCSQYSKDSIEKKGLIIGAALTAKRALLCNPFRKLSDEKIKELAKKM